jgi:hypothetical protein
MPIRCIVSSTERADVGDAVRGIGRGMRGVELARGERARFMPALNLGRVGTVGQIAGHQRGEIAAGGQGSEDARAIGFGRGDIGHRRREVGHHDGSGELLRGVRDDRLQHRAVAQMDMPVVGAADGQAIGHDNRPTIARRDPPVWLGFGRAHTSLAP